MNLEKPEVAHTIIGYKRLIAWQKADRLAKFIYEISALFPKSELYGLTSQLRRAALSVPLNIVEGYARNNKNELRRFLSISLGSLAEVRYLLEFSLEQKYLPQQKYEEVLILLEECGRIIWKLYQSQNK